MNRFSLYKNRKTSFNMSLIFILLLFSVSCATINKPKNDEKSLLIAVQGFLKAMKWEEYKIASVWVAPSAKEDFWKNIDRFQGKLHLLDYEIRDIGFQNPNPTKTVLLRCRYYSTSDPELRTKTLHQKWVFSVSPEGWQVLEPDLGGFLSEQP